MNENKKINDSLPFEIELNEIGNSIGDYLAFIELEAALKINNSAHKKQVTEITDIYAKRLDKILHNYKINLIKDVKEITSSLLKDIEAINDSYYKNKN